MSEARGLARYGVRPRTIVREPTRDSEGVQICPECGHPVGTSKSAHKVHQPDVIDRDLRQRLKEPTLIVFGWACDTHPYDVVLPARVSSMREGWVGVEIGFADGHQRKVPVPERELPAVQGGGQRVE